MSIKSLLKETLFFIFGNFYALIDKRKPTQCGLDGFLQTKRDGEGKLLLLLF